MSLRGLREARCYRDFLSIRAMLAAAGGDARRYFRPPLLTRRVRTYGKSEVFEPVRAYWNKARDSISGRD